MSSPKRLSPDEVDAFAIQAARKLSELALNYLCTIVAVSEDGERRYIGTGFRVATSARVFVATCEHVLREASTFGEVVASTAVHRYVPIVAKLNDATYTNHEADVALAEYEPHEPPFGVAVGADFLEPAFSSENELLCVVGFPGTTTRHSAFIGTSGGFLANGLTIHGTPTTDFAQPLPMDWFAIAYNKDETVVYEDRENEWPRDEVLRPEGLSGSPVWNLNVQGKDISNWHPADATIIGVVVRWDDESGILICQKVDPLLSLLRQF